MRVEDCPFKKGDIVQIKSWKELCKEFGGRCHDDGIGYIQFPDSFSITDRFEHFDKVIEIVEVRSFIKSDYCNGLTDFILLEYISEGFAYHITPHAVKTYDYNQTNIFGLVNKCAKVLQDEIKSVTGEK